MKDRFMRNILLDYERKRDRNRQRKEDRIMEVYNKLPEIQRIDDEIKRLGLSISRALLQDPENPHDMLQNLRESLEVLRQDKAFLLTENNIQLDYLDDNYECELCEDTGFLSNGQRCNCFKQEIINYTYSMSNIQNVLKKENFQSFDINLFSNEIFEDQANTPRENMMHILNVCEGFVFNFEHNNEENLLFYGPTGLGKTFLANCIAKALLDRGKIVIYQTAFKIFELLEEIRFHKRKDKREANLLFDAELLIIDDLGTELTNTFTNSELFNIINSRLLANKKTIISTNLTPKEIMDRYDDRISSRLFSKFTILKFYGKDLRWE